MRTESGILINGIFKLDPLVTFTKDDLVNKDGIFYVAQSDSLGIDPETDPRTDSIKYKLYHEQFTVNTIGEYDSDYASNKLVPSFLIHSILSSYLHGYRMDGTLTTIENDVDLDAILVNASYFLKGSDISGLPTNFDPTENQLLKVYSKGTLVVQEILNFVGENIYYRYTSDGGTSWTSWSQFFDYKTAPEMQVIVDSNKSQRQSYLNVVKDVTENLSQYFTIKRIKSSGLTQFQIIPQALADVGYVIAHIQYVDGVTTVATENIPTDLGDLVILKDSYRIEFISLTKRIEVTPEGSASSASLASMFVQVKRSVI